MQTTQLANQEVKRIWEKACAQLQIRLSPAVYSTWIVLNPLTKIEYGANDTCLATITSPTAFHSTNLKKNLHEDIREALYKALDKECEILYQVGQNKDKNDNGFNNLGQSFTNENNLESPLTNTRMAGQSPRVEDLFSENTLLSASEDRVRAISKNIGLRKDYTFETFAVSTTNEMAHAASTAVSNNPGTSYNPLFLYGGVGVGKTHLMHAIGNNILRSNSDMKMVYCTGEEFTNEIVQAIQKKQANKFKYKFRNAGVFLIDDVQFIAGKNTVQEEFFHTFNALIANQNQIVLTSDRPPHEISLLEDRLRSRFEAGLMIDIQQPSFELRTAIVLVKSKSADLNIPIELAKTIASKVDSARKIEGIITSIRLEVELKGKTITPELIEELLKFEVKNNKISINASPSDIIKTVANHYKLKQTALKGKRRVKSLVLARHVAMYLLKNELDLPLVEIGRWFSGRDHTSVLHAVNKIEKNVKGDDLLRRDLSALKTTLSSSYN
jgi:chromosomal replication initiator protein